MIHGGLGAFSFSSKGVVCGIVDLHPRWRWAVGLSVDRASMGLQQLLLLFFP